MPERQRMTTRLKSLFQRPELFVLAGGINPIGAKMAEALGYDAFYMSGGNTSAHQLGWPDSGTSMRDMVDNARKIVLSVQIPVFADADTGYGDAISTHYTVREYIQAGIAGAHIEDQTFSAEIRSPPPLYLDSGDGRKAPGGDGCQTGSRPGLRDHGAVRSRRRAGRQLCGDY
jgi:2-methylisocitrate lyase-like PEP mutase family enzyme